MRKKMGTPALWILDEDELVIYGQDGLRLMDCATAESGVSDEAMVANARLAAVAPELLAALLVALPFVEDCEEEGYKRGQLFKAQRMIRNAIAKAEKS